MAVQSFGKYIVKRLIGRGGMGEVYLAHAPGFKRDVAIKSIFPQLAREPSLEKRFRREAELVAGLRHDHIVRLFDFDVVDEQIFMVMEYLDGGSLKDRLEKLRVRKETMPLEAVGRFLESIGSALDYAHAQGAIHRDIKPANILFTSEGKPVITDFGIAKLNAESVQITTDGAVVGTPAYMSPEQAAGKPVDARSDLYSLGVILYEMVTGRVPFQGDTPTAVLMQHLTKPPPAPRQFNQNIPDALQAVILKALAKDPDARFTSGSDLAGAFDVALRGEMPTEDQERDLSQEPTLREERPEEVERVRLEPLVAPPAASVAQQPTPPPSQPARPGASAAPSAAPASKKLGARLISKSDVVGYGMSGCLLLLLCAIVAGGLTLAVSQGWIGSVAAPLSASPSAAAAIKVTPLQPGATSPAQTPPATALPTAPQTMLFPATALPTVVPSATSRPTVFPNASALPPVATLTARAVTFGPITFAPGAAADRNPVDPATAFPGGLTAVYAIFSYDGAIKGNQWHYERYLDGKLQPDLSDTGTDLSGSGNTWLRLWSADGIRSGNWELRLYIMDKLVQKGTYTIQGTVPGAAYFGRIQFAEGIKDDQPLNPHKPLEDFKAGTTIVYAFFDAANMYRSPAWKWEWSRDGKSIQGVGGTETWPGDVNETDWWLNIHSSAGLDAGTYELKLYVEDQLVQLGTFVIDE